MMLQKDGQGGASFRLVFSGRELLVPREALILGVSSLRSAGVGVSLEDYAEAVAVFLSAISHDFFCLGPILPEWLLEANLDGHMSSA